MEDKYLEHVGVLGMKWGVRRGRQDSSGQAHSSKVKSLKAQIKDKKMKEWDKDRAKMGQLEKAMNAKLDNAVSKKLSSFDKQSLNRVDRLIGRTFIKMAAGIDRSRIIGKIEAKYISKEARKKAAYRKAESDIDTKYANMWSDRYKKEVKGSFGERLRAIQKIDKETSRQMLEDLLEAELKFT
jgi:hypothetical protein